MHFEAYVVLLSIAHSLLPKVGMQWDLPVQDKLRDQNWNEGTIPDHAQQRLTHSQTNIGRRSGNGALGLVIVSLLGWLVGKFGRCSLSVWSVRELRLTEPIDQPTTERRRRRQHRTHY